MPVNHETHTHHTKGRRLNVYMCASDSNKIKLMQMREGVSPPEAVRRAVRFYYQQVYEKNVSPPDDNGAIIPLEEAIE